VFDAISKHYPSIFSEIKNDKCYSASSLDRLKSKWAGRYTFPMKEFREILSVVYGDKNRENYVLEQYNDNKSKQGLVTLLKETFDAAIQILITDDVYRVKVYHVLKPHFSCDPNSVIKRVLHTLLNYYSETEYSPQFDDVVEIYCSMKRIESIVASYKEQLSNAPKTKSIRLVIDNQSKLETKHQEKLKKIIRVFEEREGDNVDIEVTDKPVPYAYNVIVLNTVPKFPDKYTLAAMFPNIYSIPGKRVLCTLQKNPKLSSFEKMDVDKLYKDYETWSFSPVYTVGKLKLLKAQGEFNKNMKNFDASIRLNFLHNGTTESKEAAETLRRAMYYRTQKLFPAIVRYLNRKRSQQEQIDENIDVSDIIEIEVNSMFIKSSKNMAALDESFDFTFLFITGMDKSSADKEKILEFIEHNKKVGVIYLASESRNFISKKIFRGDDKASVFGKNDNIENTLFEKFVCDIDTHHMDCRNIVESKNVMTVIAKSIKLILNERSEEDSKMSPKQRALISALLVGFLGLTSCTHSLDSQQCTNFLKQKASIVFDQFYQSIKFW
jgi:hypothetical protein